MKNKISLGAQKVQTFIQQQGYDAYFVGGCVRDLLLERVVNDFDITTNCPADLLLELAKNNKFVVIPTGLQHGTITFVVNNEHIEVTTYRHETTYINHRFPSEVTFTSDLKEDLSRRDFTINALAYRDEQVIDYFSGLEDLNQQIIRCIGNPNDRFQEDALRILRAIRFSFTLNFKIEEQTLLAIKENAKLLQHISRERIRDELCKMLLSDADDILPFLKDTNTLLEIIPEMSLTYDVLQETPYHIYDVFHHLNACLNYSKGYDLNMKLAVLLHDIEKKNYKTIDEHNIAHFKGHAHASARLSKKILRNLKFDNDTIKEVSLLIHYHDYYLSREKKHIRTFLYKLRGNFPLAKRILQLQKIDNLGKHPDIISDKNTTIDDVLTIIDTMHHEAFNIKALTINGNDLLALGFEPKNIGTCLEYLLKYVCNQQDKNTKEHLLKVAGGIKNEIIDS